MKRFTRIFSAGFDPKGGEFALEGAKGIVANQIAYSPEATRRVDSVYSALDRFIAQRLQMDLPKEAKSELASFRDWLVHYKNAHRGVDNRLTGSK